VPNEWKCSKRLWLVKFKSSGKDDLKNRLILPGATDEQLAKSEPSIEPICWMIALYSRINMPDIRPSQRVPANLSPVAKRPECQAHHTHPHLGPRFRLSEAIYSRPLHYFIACTELPFHSHCDILQLCHQICKM
jgi:hypothetical protein